MPHSVLLLHTTYLWAALEQLQTRGGGATFARAQTAPVLHALEASQSMASRN